MDQATRCAVVGGGPGGVMLAYLLARAGVPVTLLEARPDFDRRFRGDALALSVLELLDVLVWPIRCSPRSHTAQRTASLIANGIAELSARCCHHADAVDLIDDMQNDGLTLCNTW